ncbi:MAG: hypothetical protein ACK5LR_05840 [Mangrovibacterium sp.]
MKKLLIMAVAILGFATVNAQEVGIRFGMNSGANNVAVDGIFELGQFSRVHANVNFFDGGMGVDALWDCLYRPFPDVANLNWYAGFGPSITLANSYFGLGVSGEVGLEYRFADIPLAIGLDWRPTFWILEETDMAFNGFGLNIRYVF